MVSLNSPDIFGFTGNEQVTLMGRWLYELQDKRSIGSVAGWSTKVAATRCSFGQQLFNG